MSWVTGTADDYLDAVAELKTAAEANGWATDRYTTSGEYEWIATGNGSGADVIVCGVRTFSEEQHDLYNWELAGMDTFAGASAWSAQPGISPGRHDGASNAVYGSYALLSNRSMKYAFSATSRRLTGWIRVGNIYQTFYIGWGMPFDTPGNYADPKIIAGSCYDPNLRYADVDIRNSGIINPIGSATVGREGPMQLHNRAGSWETVKNRTANDASSDNIASSPSTDLVCWPMGNINFVSAASGEDSWVSTVSAGATYALSPNVFIPTQTAAADFPGNQRLVLRRVPNGVGEDAVVRLPAKVFEIDELHAELDGVFWASAAAGPNDPAPQPEDRVEDVDNPGTFYSLVPMGMNGAKWNYCCFEEK